MSTVTKDYLRTRLESYLEEDIVLINFLMDSSQLTRNSSRIADIAMVDGVYKKIFAVALRLLFENKTVLYDALAQKEKKEKKEFQE